MDGLTKRIVILVAILTLCHICLAIFKPGKTEVPNIPQLEQPSFYDTDKEREVPC